MKKFTILLVMSAFLLSGALLNSCKKDELQNTSTTPSQKPMLKEMSTFALPIYMGQEILIGSAMITYNPAVNEITVAINLDDLEEGWEITEAHLYAGEAVPPNAPGQFPFAWEPEDGDLGFVIAGPEWVCPGFTWYYALHLALKMDTGEFDEYGNPIYEYESAWLLPEEGGINWYNKGKKGNQIGWGQYFLWEFDYTPYLEGIELTVSPGSIDGDYENGFEMCLNPLLDYYYFDTEIEVSVPLEMNYPNPFFLEEVLDPDFWSYWDLKGVNAMAAPGTWQYGMWQIINGDAPMFFVKWDGTDYSLIDGLQYMGGVDNPLRISGDYPEGIYSFTGFLVGDYCDGDEFTIELTVHSSPVVSNLQLFSTNDPTADPIVWTPIVEIDGEFDMCLDDAIEFYYFDTDFDVNVPLADGLNAFSMDTVDPVLNPAFWSDWDAKGVNALAAAGTWQYYMWQIINQQLPMFYVKVVGSDYTLIDGMVYAWLEGTETPLRISGDYTPGTYGFTGFLEGVECDGAPFTINLTVYPCE